MSTLMVTQFPDQSIVTIDGTQYTLPNLSAAELKQVQDWLQAPLLPMNGLQRLIASLCDQATPIAKEMYLLLATSSGAPAAVTVPLAASDWQALLVRMMIRKGQPNLTTMQVAGVYSAIDSDTQAAIVQYAS